MRGDALYAVIHNIAELTDRRFFKVREIPDIEPMEVDVVNPRISFVFIFRNNPFKVRLAELVASSRASAPELDAFFTHALH